MSSVDRRLTSFALWLVQRLEDNTRSKVRVLAVAVGILATIGIWVVHLSFPHIFQSVIESENKIAFVCLFGVLMAPPFTASFSAASIIWPANEPVQDDSGPMSGYFYRERADKRWKMMIVAGIIAAINFLLMFITSDLS